jgi:3D (Asp-Asp-Asp) domain-containing protein
VVAATPLWAACSGSSPLPSATQRDGGGDPVDASRATDGGSQSSPESSAPASPEAGGSDDSSAPADAAETGARETGAQETGAGAPEGGTSDASADAGTTQVMEATFYGWDDNSPPGNAIAYPKSAGYPTVHDAAGGTGTYADPITFATDPTELPPGTILYAPFIQKYLVMEDSCGQCETDWASGQWHIDIWMNSNGTEQASSLFACEDTWTQSSTPILMSPAPGLTVSTTPLFDPSTNTCSTSP